jgi:pyroglutamyl-peptidase
VSVVLLTGFEPYNGAEENPSGAIALRLDGDSIGGALVVGRVLPVSATLTPDAIRSAIDEVEPEVILMLGLWPGKHALQVERVAVNVLDFPFPDNDGAQPSDVPFLDEAPVAYFARVPVKAVARAWREAGLPGLVSNSAGTYVCNQSFYAALHHTADRDVPVGFVHIPSSLEQASQKDPPEPGMPLNTLVDGVRVALEAIVAASPIRSAATSDTR